MWMVLTLLAAAIGGLILLKLKVPGGMLVGAILGVAILNITTQQATFYSEGRLIAQVLTGAYIGCMVTREDVCHLPKLIGPYFTVITSFLVLNLCMGTIFCRISDFDLLTCLFCTAPGGVSDMPLIAMDMGADGSAVAIMQFVRMLFGLGCLPTIIKLSDQLIEPEKAKALDDKAGLFQRSTINKAKTTLRGFLPTFILALGAGILGKISGVPAGALSAAFFVTAVLKIMGKGSSMPMWLRRVAQVISGCCIGCTVNKEQVSRMGQLMFPAVLLCIGYVLCCVIIGLLISKVFHMELRESMLSLSPAGVSEMVFIAADLGVESTNLVVLQICRLVSVVLVFPHIFLLTISFIT